MKYFSLSLALLLAAPAAGDNLSAAQIAARARDAEGVGLSGGTAQVRLTVTDAAGTRVRTLTAVARKEGGETRRLIRFQSPPEVAGVAVLVIQRAGQPVRRLLWLPAQHRVRSIGAAAGAQSFMETDFSYADLDLAGSASEEYRRLPDAPVDGNPCWVVAITPAGPSKESSPYGRVVMYVHQQTSVPLRVDFFDRAGALLKQLRVHRVKQVAGRWFATDAEMVRADGKSRTRLELLQIAPEQLPQPGDLTERALQRE